MHISKEELRDIDEQLINSLSCVEAKGLCLLLVDDLKEAHERLNQNSQNSSLPPSSNPPWAQVVVDDEEPDDDQCEPLPSGPDDPEDCSGPDAKPQPPDSQITPDKRKAKKPGKQKGAKGCGRTQKLPIHHIITHRADTCASCNRELDITAPFIACTGHYVIDLERGNNTLPGMKVINTKHLYGDTICGCGHVNRIMPYRSEKEEEWNIEVTQWHLVGPTLASLIVCLSKRMRLSRRRIQEFLRDWLCLDLSTGTINKCIHEAGRALSPLVDELLEAVRASGLVFIDETSWRERTKKQWLWVFTSLTVTFYIIGFRSRDVLEYVLGQTFKGLIMTDGYVAYRILSNRLRCWAHLLRKARGLKESLSDDPRQFGNAAFNVLTELMDAVYRAREGPPTDLVETYKDFLAEFQELCRTFRDSRHEKTRELAREFLNDWSAIFHVLANPQWPLTNNEAEQALRHWVIARRLSHGTRNSQGSQVFTILASVIDSCRKRNACPWKYLAEVIAACRQGQNVPPLPLAA